jgi:hypothetical protein
MDLWVVSWFATYRLALDCLLEREYYCVASHNNWLVYEFIIVLAVGFNFVWLERLIFHCGWELWYMSRFVLAVGLFAFLRCETHITIFAIWLPLVRRFAKYGVLVFASSFLDHFYYCIWILTFIVKWPLIWNALGLFARKGILLCCFTQ